MRIKEECQIESGKLENFDRESFEKKLTKFKDGDVSLLVQDTPVIRSPEANAYYWAHVIKLWVEHTGYKPLEMHETFKSLYNPVVVFKVDIKKGLRESHTTGGTTTKMTKRRFWEFIQDVKLLGEMEQGIVFEDSDEWIKKHPEEVERYSY